jgi:hypothetical protein
MGSFVVRRLLSSLIVLAFALRSVVPVGFMLAPAANGDMTMVICTGHGPATIPFTADGKVAPAKQKSSTQGLCSYASVGGVTLNAPVAEPAAAEFAFAALAFRPVSDDVRAAMRAGATSARGPPLHS